MSPANVDWSGTRAYGLGLNESDINVRGPRSRGIVQAGEGRQQSYQEIKTKPCRKRIRRLDFPVSKGSMWPVGLSRHICALGSDLHRR